MKLFAFNYCDCIYESSYATVSLHISREGAEAAMNEHIRIAKEEYDEYTQWHKDEMNCNPQHKFGWSKAWSVDEVDVLP